MMKTVQLDLEQAIIRARCAGMTTEDIHKLVDETGWKEQQKNAFLKGSYR